MNVLYHTTHTERYYSALDIKSRETYLYTFKNKKNGLFKIGVSYRPYTRMLALLTDSKDRFYTRLYGKVVPYKERFLIEKYVHRRLSKYRKFGEWFDFGNRDERIVARAISIILATMKESGMTPEEALEELVRIVQETGCPRCRHGRDGTCTWPVPDGGCVGFQGHDRLTKPKR